MSAPGGERSYSLAEIAGQVGGELSGSPEVKVCGVGGRWGMFWLPGREVGVDVI